MKYGLGTCVLGSYLCIASTVAAQNLPVFTIDRDGPSGIGPRDLNGQTLYRRGVGQPDPVFGGSLLGLSGAHVGTDQINGFSERVLLQSFLFCFSVDRDATGDSAAQPIDFQAAYGLSGVPEFNVTQQADLGQAAGDGFLSTRAFTRDAELPAPQSLVEMNNVLTINQSPTYISRNGRFDFAVLPRLSPGTANSASRDVDDIGGGGSLGSGSNASKLYFTLESGSGSLSDPGFIDGLRTSADVFYDADTGSDGVTGLYASEGQLGLLSGDDINGLMVFDELGDGSFSSFQDTVLFTLAPGSPSLVSLGVDAGTVLRTTPGLGAPEIFALPETLGLAPGDNLNMLAGVHLLNDSALDTIRAKIIPAPGSALVVVLGAISGSRRRR